MLASLMTTKVHDVPDTVAASEETEDDTAISPRDRRVGALPHSSAPTGNTVMVCTSSAERIAFEFCTIDDCIHAIVSIEGRCMFEAIVVAVVVVSAELRQAVSAAEA